MKAFRIVLQVISSLLELCLKKVIYFGL